MRSIARGALSRGRRFAPGRRQCRPSTCRKLAPPAGVIGAMMVSSLASRNSASDSPSKSRLHRKELSTRLAEAVAAKHRPQMSRFYPTKHCVQRALEICSRRASIAKVKFMMFFVAGSNMNRAGIIRFAVLAWCCLLLAPSISRGADAAETGRFYPANLPAAQWQKFSATGFSKPVTGIVYRGEPRSVSGVPLGGVGTGHIDLESAGTFGYSSIFNYLAPEGGPLNTPFLGISLAGKTWVLTTGETKPYDAGNGPVPPLGPKLLLTGVKTAKSIDYWGHFPVADLEYETDAPVSVGL